MKAYLEAGEFVATHGVAGELRLYPHADGPDFLAGFSAFYGDEKGGGRLELLSVRPHKSICIVKLAGVDSIAEARPYIGRTVYIARADAKLPEGRFFVQDILNARVLNADSGKLYGRLTAVTHPGRHDVYEIEGEAGEQWLFPAVEPFLVSIDFEAGEVAEVLVRPIEGMFEPPVPPKAKPKKPRGAAKSPETQGEAP